MTSPQRLYHLFSSTIQKPGTETVASIYEFKPVALNNMLDWVLEMLIVEGSFGLEPHESLGEVLQAELGTGCRSCHC